MCDRQYLSVLRINSVRKKSETEISSSSMTFVTLKCFLNIVCKNTELT